MLLNSFDDYMICKFIAGVLHISLGEAYVVMIAFSLLLFVIGLIVVFTWESFRNQKYRNKMSQDGQGTGM